MNTRYLAGCNLLEHIDRWLLALSLSNSLLLHCLEFFGVNHLGYLSGRAIVMVFLVFDQRLRVGCLN